jgi:hypothetical protein
MIIALNHTLARDKEAAARFFAQLFELNYNGGRRAPPTHWCSG